ncbi:tRNA pseudouridine(55) synthase TruB [Anoxybacter fermentans]|uniref:tRNA pseudouridine synthase B n=1 Tax=Anoxybacter fermentans TaxID=1323375 RepID=A0A3Q9HPD0_9FIRM|nr:tRNA pseudouridine(55) synthase TruB [Anoxybacter fermentans]AZR72396.1 tRNA pseudouridine(55) synthase TruB [Anoxybacter fermentans]
MNGILNILKPAGMTSFDVVAKIKGLVKTKKVGHTGTLDPDAVGVLPICLGKATRMVEFLMEDRKFYRAQVTLGIETDTQDAKGKIIAQHEISNIDEGKIRQVLTQFIGKIEQIPPMVSAVKHKGKRLYELARQGIEVERKPREVKIYSLKLLRVNLPHFWIDVECSKGTYIRTLAHDIGKALGVGAHLSYLIRIKTGEFSLEESVTIPEVFEASQKNRISDLILPIDWGVRSLPKVLIKDKVQKKAYNGGQLQKRDYQKFPEGLGKGELVRVYSKSGFISISEVYDPERQILRPVKVFA